MCECDGGGGGSGIDSGAENSSAGACDRAVVDSTGPCGADAPKQQAGSIATATRAIPGVASTPSVAIVDAPSLFGRQTAKEGVGRPYVVVAGRYETARIINHVNLPLTERNGSAGASASVLARATGQAQLAQVSTHWKPNVGAGKHETASVTVKHPVTGAWVPEATLSPGGSFPRALAPQLPLPVDVRAKLESFGAAFDRGVSTGLSVPPTAMSSPPPTIVVHQTWQAVDSKTTDVQRHKAKEIYPLSPVPTVDIAQVHPIRLKGPFLDPVLFLNVRDFGAIGKEINQTAWLRKDPADGRHTMLVLSPSPGTFDPHHLRVGAEDLTSDWRLNAGIGLRFGSIAFSTRVVKIQPPATLYLKDEPGEFRADQESGKLSSLGNLSSPSISVTVDDSRPIQEALDKVSARTHNYRISPSDKDVIPLPHTKEQSSEGGVVYIPEGTYTLGVPHSKFNIPLTIGSNTTLFGEGPGKTILRVCDEARQNFLPENPPEQHACALITSSAVWFNHLNLNESPPPPDTGVAVMDLTVDGNKYNQSLLFSPQGNDEMWGPFGASGRYSLEAAPFPQYQNGIVVPLDGNYWLFASLVTFNPDDESSVTNRAAVSIYKNQPQFALRLASPHGFPDNVFLRVYYTPALKPGDPGCAKDDECSQRPVYKSYTVGKLNSLLSQADPDGWFVVGVPSWETYNGGVGYPPDAGITELGDGTLSGIHLDNVSGVSFFNVEAWNCVTEGIGIATGGHEETEVSHGTFEKLHLHHNGRYGLSMTGSAQDLLFDQCRIELNFWGGFSNEIDFHVPSYQKKIVFRSCNFSLHKNGPGVYLVDSVTSKGCDFLFEDAGGVVGPDNAVLPCVFSENFIHVEVGATATNDNGVPAYWDLVKGAPLTRDGSKALVIKNAVFMFSAAAAISVNLPCNGELSGCSFLGNSFPHFANPFYSAASIRSADLVFRQPTYLLDGNPKPDKDGNIILDLLAKSADYFTTYEWSITQCYFLRTSAPQEGLIDPPCIDIGTGLRGFSVHSNGFDHPNDQYALFVGLRPDDGGRETTDNHVDGNVVQDGGDEVRVLDRSENWSNK